MMIVIDYDDDSDDDVDDDFFYNDYDLWTIDFQSETRPGWDRLVTVARIHWVCLGQRLCCKLQNENYLN